MSCVTCVVRAAFMRIRVSVPMSELEAEKEERNMREKKRSRTFMLAGAVCAAGLVFGAGGSARAEEGAVRSSGNLVLREGEEVAVYTEDIRYLQGELDKLYAEFGE